MPIQTTDRPVESGTAEAPSKGVATSDTRRTPDTVSVAKADRTAAAFIVDNPLRDLHGLTFAAAEVALRDGAALLVPMYRQVNLFDWATPRALVVNYVRGANRELRAWAHERGTPIVVLETEGAPYVNVDMIAEGMAADSGFGEIAAFLFWSETMHQALRRAWPDRDKPVFEVAGHPRFDLLADPLRSCLSGAHDPEHPVFLFATSFPLLNNFVNNTPASELVVYWKSIGCTDWEYVDKVPLIAARLAFTFRAIQAVAKAYPHGRIIIRPHPFEGHDVYLTAFSGVPNVEVNAKASSIEAIAAADVFFHVRSNTGFEARALGVPVASLVPDGAPRIYPVDRTSVEVGTVDALLEFVRIALRGDDAQPPLAEDDLEFALGAHRGSSARRVAEAVVAVADPLVRPPRLLRAPKRSWIRPWQAVLKRHWVADERETRKAFTAADVQAWLDRWSDTLGRPRLVARDIVGRPFLDPPVPYGGAPLAVEIVRASGR